MWRMIAFLALASALSAQTKVIGGGPKFDANGNVTITGTLQSPITKTTAARSAYGQAIGAIDWSRAYAPTAVNALTTPVPYIGTGKTHPSVYYNAASWNGYRYWMAYTPMEADSQAENPSIAASHDGQTWVTPSGLTNPLVPPPPGHFNSDVDLVDGLDGSVYLFYRVMDDAIYYLRSTDGINWGARQVVITAASAGEDIMSPGVLFDGATWSMYYVSAADYSVRRRTASSPAGPWSAATVYAGIVAPEASRSWWHLSAFDYNGQVVLVLLLNDSVGHVQAGRLYLAWSNDSGATFTVAPSYVLNYGSVGTWNEAIYRATAVPMKSSTGEVKLAIWYSTMGHSLGYTEASLTPDPQTAGNTFFVGCVGNPPFGTAETTMALSPSANEVRGCQFILSRPQTVGKIRFELTTNAGSSTSSIGLYDVVGRRVLTTGAVDTSVAPGQILATLGASVYLQPGVYWMTWASSNATVALRAFSTASSALKNLVNASGTAKISLFGTTPAVAGVLPATIISSSGTGVNVPIVLFEP